MRRDPDTTGLGQPSKSYQHWVLTESYAERPLQPQIRCLPFSFAAHPSKDKQESLDQETRVLPQSKAESSPDGERVASLATGQVSPASDPAPVTASAEQTPRHISVSLRLFLQWFFSETDSQ